MAVDSDIEALPGRAVSLWRDGARAAGDARPCENDLERRRGRRRGRDRRPIDRARARRARRRGRRCSRRGGRRRRHRQHDREAQLAARASAYARSSRPTVRTRRAPTPRPTSGGSRRVAESLAAELEIECDLRRKPNYTYTEDPAQRGAIEARGRGGARRWPCRASVDARDRPAVRDRRGDSPRRSGRVPSRRYLEGLAAALDRAGPGVYEGTRATSAAGGPGEHRGRRRGPRRARRSSPPRCRSSTGGCSSPAPRVQRSYAISVQAARRRAPGHVPAGGEPGPLAARGTVARRRAADRRRRVARARRRRPVEKFEALARYARARFDAQSFEHRWSAHDFMPDDGLPYVGRL